MFKRAIFFVLSAQISICGMAQRPELLIVGTTHLNNPNHDMFNIVVDDVLLPKRQTEIVAIVNHLARFRPTRVALECAPEQQSEYDRRYADYRAGRYILGRDERDQIGMRLAAKLNLLGVDCVDYQDGPPGPENAYDFMSFAQVHEDLKPVMEALTGRGKRLAAQETDFLRSHALLEWYRRANQPAKLRESDQVYLQYIASLGDTKEHPGANWVGGWHARNMIIIENLQHLAKPTDRVFTLFGVGHAHLLHEFAAESAAFRLVGTEAYLQ